MTITANFSCPTNIRHLYFQVEPGTCFQRLMGSVKTGVILKDVSLEVHGGEVLAVLGSKGETDNCNSLAAVITATAAKHILNFSFGMHLISVVYFDNFEMIFRVTEKLSIQEHEMSLRYLTFLEYNIGVKHYKWQ